MLRVQLPVPALHSFVRSGVLVNTSSGAALLCSARDDYKRSAQNVGLCCWRLEKLCRLGLGRVEDKGLFR